MLSSFDPYTKSIENAQTRKQDNSNYNFRTDKTLSSMQKFQIKQYNFMNNMNNWISSKTSSTFNSMT